MIKRSVKKEIESAFNALDMNLANNYKDLAHAALRQVDELVAKFYSEGQLKEKDHDKLVSRIDEYKRCMAGYHH